MNNNPFFNQPMQKPQGLFQNLQPGSVYQPSRYGTPNQQPQKPVNFAAWNPNIGGPQAAPQPKTPPMPRYDQAQPMQPPSQGTPYAAYTPQQPFDHNRWQMGGRPTSMLPPPPSQPAAPTIQKYGNPGQQPMGPDGGPLKSMSLPSQQTMMQQEIDRYKKQYEEKQRNDSLAQQLDYWKNMFGGYGASAQQPQQPWSGSPIGGPLDSGYQSFGGGQYTNGKGQGFMGSMPFAPSTSDAYRNQAYGNWANSQGYFQQPQFNPFAPRYQGGGSI